MRETSKGLAALHWGDSHQQVLDRMQEMDGVHLIDDTVFTWAGVSWHTPDSVDVWSFVRHFGQMLYSGGTFVGYPVSGWEITVDPHGGLRDVRVEVRTKENRWKLLRDLSDQFERMYGPAREKQEGGLEFVGDGWAQAAADTAHPTTRIRVGMMPGGYVGFLFIQREWADSLDAVYKTGERRRLSVAEWEKEKKAYKRKTGWTIDD